MKQIIHHIADCYNSIIPSSWTKIGLLFSTILLATAVAHAQAITYYVKVANAPAGANDIHLVFNVGAAGTITTIVPVNPPTQTIANNGNGWDASWTPNFVGGETYKAVFNCGVPNLTFNSGFWTQGGVNIKNIVPGDVTMIVVVGYNVKAANAPAGANDIHLVFTGTGGSIDPIVPLNPAAQGITNNGSGWDATWTPNFVGGETYQADFYCPFPGVAFNSGFWTQGGVNIKNIVPGDVTVTLIPTNVPTLPTWALTSLIVIVAAAGLFYIGQKKYKTIG